MQGFDASTVPGTYRSGNCLPCKPLRSLGAVTRAPMVSGRCDRCVLPAGDAGLCLRSHMSTVTHTCGSEAAPRAAGRERWSTRASRPAALVRRVLRRFGAVLSWSEDGRRPGAGKEVPAGAGSSLPLRTGRRPPILIGTAPSRFQAAVAGGDVSSNFAGPVIIEGPCRGFARSDSQGWRSCVRTCAPLLPSVTETLLAREGTKAELRARCDQRE